uniref:Biogenesis of lysosome-related organelles complex 1 subunit 7 n=1 Tax=Phallusia mammillata TaxID=59560 RepID=A0A6F9DSJ8_9ASCI|nr:SNARE-associated protein Snapin-like [Phallusia mammillata]
MTSPSTSQEAEPKIEDNLFAIIKPAVEKIDLNVAAVRQSQLELRNTIDAVSNELQRISEEQALDVDLEPYIRRLINTKRRVVLVSNIVQNVQDRLNKLQRSTAQETIRKQAHQNVALNSEQIPIDIAGTSQS